MRRRIEEGPAWLKALVIAGNVAVSAGLVLAGNAWGLLDHVLYVTGSVVWIVGIPASWSVRIMRMRRRQLEEQREYELATAPRPAPVEATARDAAALEAMSEDLRGRWIEVGGLAHDEATRRVAFAVGERAGIGAGIEPAGCVEIEEVDALDVERSTDLRVVDIGTITYDAESGLLTLQSRFPFAARLRVAALRVSCLPGGRD